MKCPDCEGVGVMSETPPDEFPDWCDTCHGEGHIDSYTCHGATLTNTTLEIPKLKEKLGE